MPKWSNRVLILRILPAFFLFATVAFGQELYRGWTATSKGSEDCNPCVNNVIAAVNTLRDHGETLGFNWGDNYPTVTGSGTKRHWQGVQRLPIIPATNLDLPYVVVSSSHGEQKFPFPFLPVQPAHFAVVEFASRDTDGLRLRSNRLMRGQLTRRVPPNPQDRIVKSVNLTDTTTAEYWHPGGIQTIGKYLLIGAHSSNEMESNALISLFDMARPQMPVPVWQEKFFQNFVNSMGIVKLEDGKYLLMRATANARELDFWIGPTLEDVSGFLTDDQGGGFWDRWYHDELDPTGTNFLFDCDYIVYDDGDKGYQNTNLVTDCQTGEIYLIGTHGRCPGPIRLGSDFVDAYRVDVPKTRTSDPLGRGEGVFITKVAKRKMHPSANSGNFEGDFQGAGGIYVSPDNKLYVYATEQGTDGPGGSVKMIEFGPEEGRSVVNTMDEAWIELYEHPNFRGRSVILDYVDRDLRDYDNFANVEEFVGGPDTSMALTSSVLYGIPAGGQLRLFAGRNQAGAYFDLAGTGRVERIPDLANHHLSDGHSADDTFTSAAWDSVLTSVDPSVETQVPLRFELHQNYPNPFNPETEIRFQLPQASQVLVRIFNTLGQEIRTLTDREYEAGFHSVHWDAKDNKGNPVSSGVYLYRIKAGNFSQVKKMSLLR